MDEKIICLCEGNNLTPLVQALSTLKHQKVSFQLFHSIRSRCQWVKRDFTLSRLWYLNWYLVRMGKFGKISTEPHTIVKQICFLNGDVLFLSLFSLSKNWRHNVVWGCAEILPTGVLACLWFGKISAQPVLQFAYSSWITKAVSKTIDCLIFSSNHILQHFSLNFNPLRWITVSLNPLSHWWHGQTLFRGYAEIFPMVLALHSYSSF